MMIDISVIIPLYNAEKYIAKALDSCLSLPEVKEIIVVDDGYQDNAKAIVKGYQDKYAIIKLFEHPNNENRGAGESRNVGIRHATQDYIAFLDADDFYLPGRFQRDKEIFEKFADADGCYSAIDAYFYSEIGKEQFAKSPLSKRTTVNSGANPSPQNLFKGLLGIVPSFGHFHLDGLTVKKECLVDNNLFFQGNLEVHQDADFILRLAYHATLYPSQLNVPVAMRGVHEENRITKNFAQGENRIFQNQYLLWESLFKWAQSTKVGKEGGLLAIRHKFNYYRLMLQNDPTALKLILELIKHPSLVEMRKYPEIHFRYMGKGWFSNRLIGLRRRYLKYIKKY